MRFEGRIKLVKKEKGMILEKFQTEEGQPEHSIIGGEGVMMF